MGASASLPDAPREREKRPAGRRSEAPGRCRAPLVMLQHRGAPRSAPGTSERRPTYHGIMIGGTRQALTALGPRLVTAVVLAICAVAAAQAGGVAFLAVVTALTGIVTFEWIKMSCLDRSPGTLLLSVVAAAASGAAFAIWDAEKALAAGAVGAVLIAAAAKIERNNPFWTAAGVFFLIVSMVSTIWLRAEGAAGLATIYWLFAVVWATDSGAYLFGKLIGGARFAPRISPGKSWAGVAGGMAIGILSGIGITLLMSSAGVLGSVPNLPIIALASAVLSVFAQAGDLAESGVKRHFGVKDSGAWLPGHGGALDRLDSLILVTPILAFAILLAGGSGQLLWARN